MAKFSSEHDGLLPSSDDAALVLYGMAGVAAAFDADLAEYELLVKEIKDSMDACAVFISDKEIYIEEVCSSPADHASMNTFLCAVVGAAVLREIL